VIWHPLSLSIVALDLLSLTFALAASLTALRVLLSWDPSTTSPSQVALEAATDGASLATRYGLGFFVAGSLLLVLGIAQGFPSLVRGAMCGTGVMEAMGPLGPRALILRGLALAALWVTGSIDRLNRGLPRSPAIPLVSRWQLLTLPLIVLAALATARALLSLDPYAPVDCCQAVYDNFSSLSAARSSFGIADTLWLGAFGLGGLILGIVVLWSWRVVSLAEASRTQAIASWLLPLVVLSWVPLAGLSLVRVLAAYHYEVLFHHCPWCLFLPLHGAVGYPLFGALTVLGLEAMAFAAASRLAAKEPAFALVARQRKRRALIAIAVSLLVFLALTLLPAVMWRVAKGVWLHGS
jgi:hypothetical protein